MKKAIIFVVAVAMVVTVTNITMAGTEAGNKEIQIQGAVSNTTNSDNDDSSSTSTVQITFNYFLGSNLSIGGTWRGTSTVFEPETGDDTEFTQNFFMGRADLYLGSATSKFMPYIGGQVGIANTTIKSGAYDDSDSQSSYGIHGGIKIFSGENVSWNLELDRTIYPVEPDNGDSYDRYVDSFFAGLSYYF